MPPEATIALRSHTPFFIRCVKICTCNQTHVIAAQGRHTRSQTGAGIITRC
jgi:hypothetical protein